MKAQQDILNLKRGEIKLSNLQIKSLEKAKKVAAALTIIEEEAGIHEVRITIDDCFICPWIDLNELNATPMERLLQPIFKQTNK